MPACGRACVWRSEPEEERRRLRLEEDASQSGKVAKWQSGKVAFCSCRPTTINHQPRSIDSSLLAALALHGSNRVIRAVAPREGTSLSLSLSLLIPVACSFSDAFACLRRIKHGPIYNDRSARRKVCSSRPSVSRRPAKPSSRSSTHISRTLAHSRWLCRPCIERLMCSNSRRSTSESPSRSRDSRIACARSWLLLAEASRTRSRPSATCRSPWSEPRS